MNTDYKLTVHDRINVALANYRSGDYEEADRILKKLYAQWKNGLAYFCMIDELKMFILLDQTRRKLNVSHET